MRRITIGIVVAVLVASGAWALLAGNRSFTGESGPQEASSTQADAEASCGPAGDAVATTESAGGKLAGQFDPAMSGPCQFACATKLDYEAKDVHAQPGALDGKLTQCPVSGVVFAVDADRPHVPIAGEVYVTCCDGCADKLGRDPGRYLRL